MVRASIPLPPAISYPSFFQAIQALLPCLQVLPDLPVTGKRPDKSLSANIAHLSSAELSSHPLLLCILTLAWLTPNKHGSEVTTPQKSSSWLRGTCFPTSCQEPPEFCAQIWKGAMTGNYNLLFAFPAFCTRLLNFWRAGTVLWLPTFVPRSLALFCSKAICSQCETLSGIQLWLMSSQSLT